MIYPISGPIRIIGLFALLAAALFPAGTSAAPEASVAAISSQAWTSGERSIPGEDDEETTYNLPFTFPFFGRDIVKISINTNGLIELLEAGESCYECDDYNTHDDGDHVGYMDAIFAANDDLKTGVIINPAEDRVTITWGGTTYDDDDMDDEPLLFQVILYSDGRVVWKFYTMDWASYDGDLFSGMYDNGTGTEYEVPGGSLALSGFDIRKAFQYTPGDANIKPLDWDPNDKTHGPNEAGDDDYRNLALPFAFPFFGRVITAITVNTNGLIELLEDGETCYECSDYETHNDGDHIAGNIDAIFALNDDLITTFAVNTSPDRVLITWIGSTYDDDDIEDGIAFQVILYPDGGVVWKFYNSDYGSNSGDLYSGVYDEVMDRQYNIPGGTIPSLETTRLAYRFTPGEPAGETGNRQKTGVDGGTHRFGNVIVIVPPFAIPAGSAANSNTCDLIVTEIDDDNGNFGFTNGEPVYDIKIICGDQVINTLNLPITVCIRPDDRATAGKTLFHRHGSKGAPFAALPLVDGPDGYVCGSTSLLSAFTLGTSQLPSTGFAPGQVTQLEAQPAALAYEETDMTLSIPKLGVELDIVGVPQTPDGWDVTWLGGQAGYLNGTAFPTWAGNSVITAHVWDANNNPGPFANLAELSYGDRFTITAFGQTFVYEVRATTQVSPGNLSVLADTQYSTITLLTCEGFNESTQEYAYRRVVTAVLVEIR